MLTAKIDLFMKKLENLGLNHVKMASSIQRSPRMSTSLVIPTMVFVLIKASMLGGTSSVSRSTTANRVLMGRISTEMSPLSKISSGISKDK
jgi:hypothetical protein